jgi:hypothetical protein
MKNRPLNSVLLHFDKRKHFILNKIEAKIESYISSQTTTFCLSLKDNKGKIYKPTINPIKLPGYAGRLALFITPLKNIGSNLDSALTKPVTEKVSEELCSFYQAETEAISKYIQEEIVENQTLQKIFRENVIGSLVSNHLSKEARRQVIDLIMDSLKENAGNMATAVEQKVSIIAGKAVTMSSTVPISKAIATKISYLLGSQVKYFLAKALATPAVKAIIVPIIKKVVIVGIVAGFVKLIAAKTGASVGAIVATILIPIIVWWIVHEWECFPDSLSEKVSRKVCEELSGSYRTLNIDILRDLPADFLDRCGSDISKSLLTDEEIKNGVHKLGEEIDKFINVDISDI